MQTEELFEILQTQLNLTWKYQVDLPSNSKTNDASAKEIDTENPVKSIEVVPQAEDLQHLLNLVQRGLMKKLIAEAKRLEQSNSAYKPFLQEVIHLAKTFQMEKLESWIEQHIR